MEIQVEEEETKRKKKTYNFLHFLGDMLPLFLVSILRHVVEARKKSWKILRPKIYSREEEDEDERAAWKEDQERHRSDAAPKSQRQKGTKENTKKPYARLDGEREKRIERL